MDTVPANTLTQGDPAVGIGCAIVTFRTTDLERIRAVVHAALAQAEKVLVVDNGSPNATAIRAATESVAEGRRDALAHLPWKVNRGLGAAYNAAFAWAREADLRELVLLDHDSILQRDAVLKLAQRKREETEAGHIVAAVAAVPLDPRRRRAVGAARRRVVQTSGCMISVAAFGRVGQFDESLFVHHVDQDWFLRARHAGYRTVVEPLAHLDHLSGHSVTNLGPLSFPHYSPDRFYFVVRNTLLMMRRSYAPILWKTRYMAELVAQMVLHLVPSPDWHAYWRSLIRGIRDAVDVFRRGRRVPPRP